MTRPSEALASNILFDDSNRRFNEFDSLRAMLLEHCCGPFVPKELRRMFGTALEFDSRIESAGMCDAFGWMLQHTMKDLTVRNAAAVPVEGPLVLAANHPGNPDAIAIAASIRRPDLKIMCGVRSFTLSLPNLRRKLIPSPPDTRLRVSATVAILRHLRSGGALLIFPRGSLEPDPAIHPAAADSINEWSRSVAFFLRTVPETQFVAAAVSHVLDVKFLEHPLVAMGKTPAAKQRIAEFLQTCLQLLVPKSYRVSPRVTFSDPTSALTFESDNTDSLMPFVVRQARQTLDRHVACFRQNQGRTELLRDIQAGNPAC